jgi:cyclohexyl-isocyanide hydratase
VNQRVVVDGKYVSTAGVSSGIDGALRVVQVVAGERAAQAIQLLLQYAPEPLYPGGTPETSPPEIVELCRANVREISDRRLATAWRVAQKLGIISTS